MIHHEEVKIFFKKGERDIMKISFHINIFVEQFNY